MNNDIARDIISDIAVRDRSSSQQASENEEGRGGGGGGGEPQWRIQDFCEGGARRGGPGQGEGAGGGCQVLHKASHLMSSKLHGLVLVPDTSWSSRTD